MTAIKVARKALRLAQLELKWMEDDRVRPETFVLQRCNVTLIDMDGHGKRYAVPDYDNDWEEIGPGRRRIIIELYLHQLARYKHYNGDKHIEHMARVTRLAEVYLRLLQQERDDAATAVNRMLSVLVMT